MIAESSVGDMASAIKHLKVAASAGSQDAFESFDECIPSQSNSQRRAGISLAFSGQVLRAFQGQKAMQEMNTVQNAVGRIFVDSRGW